MRIGYARVSSDDQNLDLQNDALRAANCEKIFEDRMSGIRSARPGLQMLLEVARQGDVIVVWRLDRLGRSLGDLIKLMGVLESRGIELTSLHEKIDTTSSTGKLVFHMFGALAEFEGNLIRDRTRAGLSAARARGRTGGRPKLLDAKKQKMLLRLYNGREHSIAEICELLNISKTTLYSYLESAGQ